MNRPIVVTSMRIAAGAFVAAVLGSATAADYPIKPIKLVVPVGAGSASDVRARQIAQEGVEA